MVIVIVRMALSKNAQEELLERWLRKILWPSLTGEGTNKKTKEIRSLQKMPLDTDVRIRFSYDQNDGVVSLKVKMSPKRLSLIHGGNAADYKFGVPFIELFRYQNNSQFIGIGALINKPGFFVVGKYNPFTTEFIFQLREGIARSS